MYGLYLANAEGEEVTEGCRVSMPLSSVHVEMPEIYRTLVHISAALENHYKDMQVVEFTVQNMTLYLLETRSAPRSPRAAADPEDPQVVPSVLGKGYSLHPGAAQGTAVFGVAAAYSK
ncbi:hypothetical protein B484DRAFT_436879, partial [Ochromonadaceae sp. CCMP2298]